MKTFVLPRRAAFLRRHRSATILGAQAIFVLVDPLVLGSAINLAFVGIAGLASLTLTVWPLRRGRLVFMSSLLFTMMLGEILSEFGIGEPITKAVARAATVGFCIASIAALLEHVMNRRPITMDKIFGAIAAYVMIGVLFATIFSLLQLLQPDALFVNMANDTDGMLVWSDMVYFSFTILTTTGLGEITPVTHQARSLIIVEQVLGIMYVAFLVARLANLYSQRRPKGRL